MPIECELNDAVDIFQGLISAGTLTGIANRHSPSQVPRQLNLEMMESPPLAYVGKTASA